MKDPRRRDGRLMQGEGATPFVALDPLTCPLGGVRLIEASAGTGKTHTISSLYLRLVLEKRLPVSRILVVTFTRAAVEELRDRIRRRLREAQTAFLAGRHEDAFLNLLAGSQAGEQALRDLETALRDFDEAAIYTIHGFCRRALREHAFETGSLFDTELLVDDRRLCQDIVEDFWRKHIYPAPREFIHYALSRGFSPAELLKRINRALLHRPIHILPIGEAEVSGALSSLRQAFEDLRRRWPESRTSLEQCLLDPGLKGTGYGTLEAVQGDRSKRERLIRELLDHMDFLVRLPYPPVPLFKGFEKLTYRYVQGAVKKGSTPPEHPLFALCQGLADSAEALQHQFDRTLLRLRAEIIPFVRDGLTSRKQNANIRTFEDLVGEMKTALLRRGGDALERILRERFGAALIDEFQDTDPDQYTIFQRVFGRDTESSLFLIGDPKQAIYGFRGADLLTYLRACREVPDRYTLRRNWRSDSGLIDSFNALFAMKPRPFLFNEILYTQAEAAQPEDTPGLAVNGQEGLPMQVWLLEPGADPAAPSLTKGWARQTIAEGVAGEVRRLVSLGRQGRALIGAAPLRERDIAVLVRKNREARTVQEALGAVGIRSVLFSTGNLFDTIDALEVERILSAVLHPDHEASVTAALATDTMGFRGEDVEGLRDSETAWEALAERFREYHALWRDEGFLPMFRFLISREKVRQRLLAFPDGERRLTNILHLSEVLHHAALEGHLGMRGLLKWLAEQRQDESLRVDEHQLRLESDEDAVRIVTIHKSKGLEYPVVFCPFNWDTLQPDKEEALFHDQEDERLTLDLGSPDLERHLGLAARERLAEDLRLLYVSVTRAKHRCYLVWGPIRGAEHSALAYLLSEESRGAQVAAEAASAAPGCERGNSTPMDLDRWVAQAPGSIAISPIPREAGEPLPPLPESPERLQCRTFSASLALDWKVASFSSLAAGHEAMRDLPDHDARILRGTGTLSLPDLMEDRESPNGIHAFPRGTRAGTFFHDVLANHDFTEQRPEVLDSLVARKLRQYGFDPSWVEAVTDTVLKVLHSPLDPAIPDLQLSGVQQESRMDEMEFYYPIKTLTPAGLARLYKEFAGPWDPEEFPEIIERLQFTPARGFMKGFMDLVFHWRGRFYLADWKSNVLGSRVEDYGRRTMGRVMVESFYVLQYHIYILALDLYLRTRVPGYRYETHFGGAYYLFLRGMDPEAGAEFGIFRDHPSPELISALNEALVPPPSREIGLQHYE